MSTAVREGATGVVRSGTCRPLAASNPSADMLAHLRYVDALALLLLAAVPLLLYAARVRVLARVELP